MAILTIGRVGLDVEMGHPSELSEERNLDAGRNLLLRGWLMGTSQATTLALRSELVDQIGQLVAVTYTLDTTIDGFYIPTDVRIEAVLSSYRGRGAYRFEVSLLRIGTDSRTELQSLITGAAITNSHSLAGDLWWAAPPGALAISTGTTAVIEHSRGTEDGVLGVFLGVSTDDDPTWSISPSGYYDGSARVFTGGRLRAGQDFRNDPANWELTNGIIRVRPVTFGGSSTGRLDFSFHESAVWSTDTTFKIVWANTTDLPAWHYMTCMRNTPELVILRLVRDAATAPPSSERHVLDIQLRRGAPFVSCYYTYTGAAASHAVARDSADASTAGNGHIRDSSLIDGHRWILGSPRAFGTDLVNGKINLSVAAQTLPFFIGAALNDSADGSHNGPTDITNQYIGHMSETVRAIRR